VVRRQSGMMWYYNNKLFEPDEEFLEDYVGFVYQITEIETNKKYIGKKFFWSTKRLPPLKGKKLRRKVTKQSNWREYFGSNGELIKLVEDKGGESYHREILRLCRTKGECSYYEAKLQFDYDVLLRDEYFNEFVGCKIHSRHLPKDLKL